MSDSPNEANRADEVIPLSIPVVAGNEWAYVKECLDDGWLAAGPMLDRFEESLAALTGSRNVVACSSGTAALHVCLLLAGVRPGDTVIVPTLTFAATANAVRYCGAQPIFVGCDEFMNLDPDVLADFLDEECKSDGEVVATRAGDSRVAAVLPVHVFGNPCDMERIISVAERFGLPVIEDAAESVGSTWTGGLLAGRHTGSVGVLGALSFNGNKIVTCGGGGAIVTKDPDLADRARYLINQAKDDGVRYIHGDVGYNYRLAAPSAAIGVAQLEELSGFIEAKRANYSRYVEQLSDVPGLRVLGIPPGTSPNYWFYSLLVEPDETGSDRETLMESLAGEGIETRPLWYPNHLQRPFADSLSYRTERAVWFWERVLNLPCSSNLTASQVDRVCRAVRAATGACH